MLIEINLVKKIYIILKIIKFYFDFRNTCNFESKNFQKTVDYNSVHEACLIGYNPNENTIFSNIRKLLPGEKLTYNITKPINYQRVNIAKKK